MAGEFLTTAPIPDHGLPRLTAHYLAVAANYEAMAGALEIALAMRKKLADNMGAPKPSQHDPSGGDVPMWNGPLPPWVDITKPPTSDSPGKPTGGG